MKIKDFDFKIDTAQALLWQYNKAATLESLVLQKQAWVDAYCSELFNSWIAGFFNLATATKDGLYVWSIILNVPLYTTQDPSPPDYPAFGLADPPYSLPVVTPPQPYNGYSHNFYQANFAVGNNGTIDGLSLEEQRILLQCRYFQLTMRPSVTLINRMLVYLFGQHKAWVKDNYDMSMTYYFKNNISPSLVSAFNQLDILLRPSGVKMNIVVQETFSFGFDIDATAPPDEKNLNFEPTALPNFFRRET